MKTILIIVGAVVVLGGGAMLYMKYQKPAESQQLTAEQVVDLEVEAERQFIEAGGQY